MTQHNSNRSLQYNSTQSTFSRIEAVSMKNRSPQLSGNRSLIEVESRLIQMSKISRISNSFKSLPLQYFYMSGGPYSGPVALLFNRYAAENDKKYFKFQQKYDNHILICNCKGELRKFIHFELKERIILFRFTAEEYLYILYANAQYFLFDSVTGKLLKEGRCIREEAFRLIGAEMVGEQILIVKDQNKKKFMGILSKVEREWEHLQKIRLCLERQLFTAAVSQKGQLQILYLNREFHLQLYNHTTYTTQKVSFTTTLYSDEILRRRQPDIVSITRNSSTLMIIFKNGYQVVELDCDKKAYFNKFDFTVNKKDCLTRSSSNLDYRCFYWSGFVGRVAVFCDEERLLLLGKKSFHLQQISNCSKLIIEEETGIRLIEEHNYFLRLVEDQYYLEMIEEHQRAQRYVEDLTDKERRNYLLFLELREMYQKSINGEVIDVVASKRKMEDVREVCDRVLQTLEICVGTIQQVSILKLLTFLNTHYQCRLNFTDSCHSLRILNQLKHSPLPIHIPLSTYNSLKTTRKSLFLSNLLRNNLHFLADTVFEDNDSKEKILTHWSKCKIEKQKEIVAVEEILGKYQEMKDKIGGGIFAELARYCLGREKFVLAEKLIQYELHFGRKIMVSLLILNTKKDESFVQTILAFTASSYSPQMVHLTIKTLLKLSQQWLSSEWISKLSSSPILENYYIQYLRENGLTEDWQNYLTKNRLYLDLGYMGLRAEVGGAMGLGEVRVIVGNKYSKVLPALANNIEKCRIPKSIQTLNQLKTKKYPIAQADASSLSSDKDYEYLSSLIIWKDKNTPLATQIIKKIKSERAYVLLKRLGKIRQAINLAFQRRDKAMIAELIEEGDWEIAEYGKKLYDELR